MTIQVVIIGAGFGGVTSIKACLEAGIEPICFEKTDSIGGLWRFREEDVEGLGSVTRNTVIKTSKEMSAFSDFPPPAEFPNLMPNGHVLRYLQLYAAQYDLLRHIRFRHEVQRVEKTLNFAESGEWNVIVKNTENGEVEEMVAQGVMVCIGHHVYPNIPAMPGLDQFQGDVIHTHSYKYGDAFRNKRVLVVGIGNSGGDAAAELSDVAKEVYLCTRRGAWILKGVGENGVSFDMIGNSRLDCFLNSYILPLSYQSSLKEQKANQVFDHFTYRLKPGHRLVGQHPTINDDLPYRIITGRVKVKGGVKRFTQQGVIFKHEEPTEVEIDAVVLATGYHIRFPFLEEDVVPVEKNRVEVYKYMLPLTLERPTLAVIGLVQPVGCIFPIAELQARWFAQLMNGSKQCPSRQAMAKDVQRKNKANASRYADSPRHTIQVDYAAFTEELAGLVGCRPNMLWLALTDPRLFWACLTGPLVAYQYRLHGPNPWNGARQAILGVEDRVLAPMDTKKLPKWDKTQNGGFMSRAVRVTAVALVVWALMTNKDRIGGCVRQWPSNIVQK